MYYLLLIAATVLFSLQFVFNKVYQREVGASFAGSCGFLVISTGIFGAAMFAVNGFRLAFTPFSLLLALCGTAIGIACGYFGIVALSVSDLAKYSLYLMLGGMAVPFVYGIACNGDAVTWQKLACFALIAAALFVNAYGQRDGRSHGWRARLSYAGIFLLNGLIGVVATIHQSPANLARAVPTSDYTIWGALLTFLASTAVLLGRKLRGLPLPAAKAHPRRAVLAAAAYGLVNGAANLMVMLSLRHIEPSVQYPIITGGCVVLSVVFGLFFRERITRRNAACAALTLAGTLLLLIP